MSISKATADRHQRILLELVAQPGNNICADCKRHNPRWASHNIGVYLCVTCASVHRKIGTHVSKVKSLTLDSWSKEQVETMKTMGNIKANQLYNPDERKHPPPTNLEHSDRGSDLEVFIRAKYEKKQFMGPKPTSSAASKITRPSSSAASDVLNMPEPTPRSKSTPIKLPPEPTPPVNALPVARPPRVSSIQATTSAPPVVPEVTVPTTQPYTPPIPQMPQKVQAPAPTPQSTGISSSTLNDMMSIQPERGSLGSQMFPNSSVGQFGGPSPVSPVQQPLNTGMQSSFGYNSMGMNGVGTLPVQTFAPSLSNSSSPYQSPISMNPTGTAFSTSSQHSLAVPGMGGHNSLGIINNGMPQRSTTLPVMSNSMSSFSPMQTGMSMMSPPIQTQMPTGNPFMLQQQQQQQQYNPMASPPLMTNMYNGNPMQAFPQQPMQQQPFSGQFNPSSGQFNPSSNGFMGSQPQPFTGSQNNPFSSNWTGTPNAGGFGAGGGWRG